MVFKQLCSIMLVLLLSLFSKPSANKVNNSSTAGEPCNFTIASAKANYFRPCSHREKISSSSFIYCDAYYEVYKVYGSGDPGDFNVNIFEQGFCPYVEYTDQGSRAECYDRNGSYGIVIVYLRFKELITYPGGSIEWYSYNETEFYATTCCGYNY